MRRSAYVLVLLGGLATVATAAQAVPVKADGLPIAVDGVGPQTTVPGVDGDDRYAAIPDGGRTRLLRIATDGGEITHTATIPGAYAVPAIALDGTPGGLAHDGDTLVLINPRTTFPRRETSFVVVDPLRLRVTEEITLEGDFSFDALSPDGRTMYVVEYPSPRDPTTYQVRAYDLRTGALAPEPILDPEEEPGEMRGYPQTRATSPDGRWEFTLYDGGGGRQDEAFIHALDVVDGETVCIDLPMVSGREAFRIDLSVSPDGGMIDLASGSDPVAAVNAETFEVSDLTGTPTTDPAATDDSDGGSVSGVAVGVIAAGVALVAGTAIGLRRRRRSGLPADPFGPGEPGDTADQAPERDRVSS